MRNMNLYGRFDLCNFIQKMYYNKGIVKESVTNP